MASIITGPYGYRMATARTLDDAHLLVVESADDRAEGRSPTLSDRLSVGGEGATDADSSEPSAAQLAGALTTASSVETALETLETDSIDCVVSAQSLTDGTGTELVERVRERDVALPFVLAPRDGDEVLASEAITAGVTEYVPAADSSKPLTETLERALEQGDDCRHARVQARQFRAVFNDPETYAWVVDRDGNICQANDRALETVHGGDDATCGGQFAALPWWDAADSGGESIRTAIDTAAAGTVAHRELTLAQGPPLEADTESAAERTVPRTLEVTVRPVRDESGTVVSVLAQVTDVTDRARLEQEVRESEELHRVTLNNMTDTVLITDDSGEFTYVCPNVHFIFGYSDDEIHEMGSIDDLLGPELFDREELESEGVLTNIECTATDRAGREHTLLVNVRTVSIQGGTTLYSCRDVTKRKRREEALTALHRTTRQLLYAESEREIAEIVVDDATDVLDLENTGAYLFDTDENVLSPAAASPAMKRNHGPLPERRAADGSLAGQVFVDGDATFFPDVHDASAVSNPATDLTSVGLVPLGDHGVFVVGSPDADAFDDVTRELTDLLATTAEAALDRVRREQTLRERDRELKQQNRKLSRLNQVNEIIREIDTALVRAETREEIEAAVCERLTSADRFSFAWIGTTDVTGERLETNTHGGTGRGRDYLDSIPHTLSETSEPAARTAATNDVTVVSNVAERLRDEPWRSEALSREYQSVAGVPLAYDEFTYGVLTVYADEPDAFEGVIRSVLIELGETIASAIAAVERKQALLTDSRTRLEFEVIDDSFIFTRLATRAECTLSFDGGIQLHEDGAAVFATVEGAPATDVVDAAADLVAVEDIQHLGDGEDVDDPASGETVLINLAPPFLALQLADHGVVLRSVEATPTDTHVVVDVPRTVDASESIDIVSNAFSDVSLVAKRTVDRTTARTLRAQLLERLTDRQLEVVQLAYYGGYFESPRERSGEEIATTLEISPAAFYRHIRTIQRKLFTILFDEIGLPAKTTAPVE
ncbi:PAS domain S-box-containing protein [Natronorubrum sediminis]|uniref:PAS domain S-box-containing protein n=2 Tax=Natronorubrum sediminis TaxID=640943 RepID=A0A1H6FZ56_9EURY|nr:PAS domain S-box-containing protein [Natronorubrum sediminis]